jgi:hypothetical protein
LGIGLIWQNSVLLALQDIGVSVAFTEHEKYELLLCNGRIVVHLIPLVNDYNPLELIELQKQYQLNGINLVQLWEDIWLSRQKQVLGRIRSILGLNKRFHGRKGVITKITQKQADHFLELNHLQGSARAKYKFALLIDTQIVAVACFSNVRFMKNGIEAYRSIELIRFATLIGFTVTGGFTKLLKYLIGLIKPNDVMSYADRDWSLGNAYEQSGFELVDLIPPAEIYLRKRDLMRFFPHRLPALEDDIEVTSNEFLSVFNTGNLKYILYLNIGCSEGTVI